MKVLPGGYDELGEFHKARIESEMNPKPLDFNDIIMLELCKRGDTVIFRRNRAPFYDPNLNKFLNHRALIRDIEVHGLNDSAKPWLFFTVEFIDGDPVSVKGRILRCFARRFDRVDPGRREAQYES